MGGDKHALVWGEKQLSHFKAFLGKRIICMLEDHLWKTCFYWHPQYQAPWQRLLERLPLPESSSGYASLRSSQAEHIA